VQTWDQLLAWMESHDKLAGWAQTVGSVLALLLAIAVPWWQRREQIRDERKRDANVEVVNARATFFLLTDIHLWLCGQKTLTNMPRILAHHRKSVENLLARVAAQEARETSGDRIAALFHARGAILQTQTELDEQYMQQHPLQPGEIKLLEQRIALMQGHVRGVRRGFDHALYLHDVSKTSLLFRPVIWWLHKTRKGRRATRHLVRLIERKQRARN
jgi:hypothetical protein